MVGIVYVNGRYLPYNRAKVSIDDRGYTFADGVYEVCEIINGKVIALKRHLDRLERSLAGLNIAMPMTRQALILTIDEVIRRNDYQNCLLYLQITRGASKRRHVPPANIKPAMVITVSHYDSEYIKTEANKGISVITASENRWAFPCIKAIALLANTMTCQQAVAKGVKDAWYVNSDGFITEGTANNAWIINSDNTIITHPPTQAILDGITRQLLIDLVTEIAPKLNIKLEQRPFSLAEAYDAHEAFITSTTKHIMPVVSIDHHKIGDGKPGEITNRLRAVFDDYIAGQ